MLRWLFGSRRPAQTEVDDGDEEARSQSTAPAVPSSLPIAGEISTDTAALIVFDLAALSHRVDDECDWWADPKDELEELRARNVLIVGLGADGFYDVAIEDRPVPNAPAFSLRVPSGTIFVGPGEEISGGGNEPDGRWGGYLISVTPGDYAASVGWADNVVRIGLVQAAPFENDASKPFRIECLSR